jgi:hypothetical protein
LIEERISSLEYVSLTIVFKNAYAIY